MDYSTMKKGGKGAYIALAVILCIITVGFIYLTYMFSEVQDSEKWYLTFLYNDEKIKNVLEIFKAQAWYFMNAGGRNVSGFFMQLMLLAGPLVTSIVNTVVLVLIGVIITAMTETMTGLKRKMPERVMCFVLTLGLMIGLSADWKNAVFTLSGVCNYVYPMLFVLLFVWVYMRELPYDCFGSKAPLPLVNLWIIPLALLAGCSNENIGPVLFVFSIVVTKYVKKVGHNVEAWMKEGSVFSFIGFVLCSCTPGNYYKLMDLVEANDSVLKVVYVQLFDMFKASFDYIFIELILVVVTLGVAKGIYGIEIGIESRYMLNMALFTWILMILAPVYPARMTFGTLVFVIIPVLAVWQQIFEKKGSLRKYAYITTGLSWLRAMFCMVTFLLYFVGLTI